MPPALCVLARGTLKADIGTAVVAHLLELARDRLALGKRRVVNDLDVWVLLLDVLQPPVLVDHDDSRCAVDERKVGAHLTNGTGSPDGYDVTLLDTSVDDAVPAGRENVREEEASLIRHVVREREEVHIAKGDASVLGLSTGEATSEMAVAEHACCPAAVHGVLESVGVGLLALRRQLLLAVIAVSAGNLERSYDTLTAQC
jgi:hypothetical protein